MLRNLNKGIPVCVTVTLLDGLVLARSIFNHSMNYRSVVVLGTAVSRAGPGREVEVLRLLSEHIIPGRWAESRQPNEKELKATLALRLPIEEFSAKVRQGRRLTMRRTTPSPPGREWASLQMVPGAPIDDVRLLPGTPTPAYARAYTRKRAR